MEMGPVLFFETPWIGSSSLESGSLSLQLNQRHRWIQENVACAATEKFHPVTPILNGFPCSRENPRCVLSSVLQASHVFQGWHLSFIFEKRAPELQGV